MNKLGEVYRSGFNQNLGRFKKRRKEMISIAGQTEICLQNLLKEKFSEFRDKTYGIDIIISIERLDLALSSYVYDVLKYKSFHGMLDDKKLARINFQKIYSFTIKWLIKEKPFYIEISGNITESKNKQMLAKVIELSNNINEIIVLNWIKLSLSSTGRKVDFDRNEVDSIVYNLKYRDFSTGMFELFLDKKLNFVDTDVM